MESAMEMGGNDEMTRLEMEMMGENVDPTGLGQPTGITLRVFINMDEDDDGDKGIDLKSLFKLAPSDLPFHIDVSYYFARIKCIYCNDFGSLKKRW